VPRREQRRHATDAKARRRTRTESLYTLTRDRCEERDRTSAVLC